jgi:hypothetical protein
MYSPPPAPEILSLAEGSATNSGSDNGVKKVMSTEY